jgi:2-polyprenyl-3-methyl-5-hydroxy-6-metoxy-1,4-benzoquinol methylase
MRTDGSSLLTPADYYDVRHARGWMDRWPDMKKERVIGILRQAGLRPGSEVLEYGCGVGVFANAAKEAVHSANVHGCDISPVGIARARKQYPAVRFHLLPDGAEHCLESYDLVYTHHVLEHVEDVKATIAQTAGLVRKGGGVVHILPCGNRDSLEYRIAKMVQNGFLQDGLFWCDDSSHARRLESETVVRWCEAHGLKLRTAYFANQAWGGFEYFTGMYPWTITDWLNPSRGVDLWAKFRLAILLAGVFVTALLRQTPSLVLSRLQRRQPWRKRMWTFLAVPLAVVLSPFAWVLNWLLLQAATWEWKYRKTNSGGSEAYLIFEKTSFAATRREGQYPA